MDDEIIKGSFEALGWVDNYKYKNYPSIMQKIMDYRLYNKFLETCNEEQLYMIQNLIKKHGLTNGLRTAYNEFLIKRSRQKRAKENYIQRQLNNQQNVSLEQLKDEMEEEERWQNLTLEQKQLKNKPFPGKVIPLEEIMAQPIIKEGTDGIVTYIVYDKIYGLYSAIVYSPLRIKKDGSQGVNLIQSSKLYGNGKLMQLVEEAIYDEKRYAPSSNISTEKDKDITIKNIDTIRKVQKYMGLNENQRNDRRLGNDRRLDNGDLNGDIF